jgi:hypothetical protein
LFGAVSFGALRFANAPHEACQQVNGFAPVGPVKVNGASGSGDIGNISFVMNEIMLGMWITSITIRSSMVMYSIPIQVVEFLKSNFILLK